MENQIQNQFREDEISLIKRFDKQRQEWITNVYPRIGGRLRLAHSENDTLSIETEIIKYDENIAVVCAVSTTSKGCFKGIGMASVERDQKIAPAILELAETRAIARSLRFAGYGVEYCSAEEVSHLENGNGNGANHEYGGQNSKKSVSNGANGGNSHSGNDGNGNGNGRLTSKQYKYLLKLNNNLGKSRSALDEHCLEAFGTVAQHLSKADASSLIENLLAQ